MIILSYEFLFLLLLQYIFLYQFQNYCITKKEVLQASEKKYCLEYTDIKDLLKLVKNLNSENL